MLALDEAFLLEDVLRSSNGVEGGVIVGLQRCDPRKGPVLELVGGDSATKVIGGM